MAQAAEQEMAHEAYRAHIRENTLSELEDIYAHLDRTENPERFRIVREEIERRLREIDARGEMPGEQVLGAAGFFRRLWASLLDLFVHLLILGVLLLVGMAVRWLIASFGAEEAVQAGPPAGRGPSPFQQFLAGLQGWDAAAWGKLGLGTLGFLMYRALLTIPAWVGSGRTPGMREMGLRIETVQGGAPTLKQALLRFWLFALTLGIGAIWMFWDARKQTLYDRLAGTRVVRLLRTWEKPMEVRVYD